MVNTVKKPECFFYPFHLFPNPFLQSRKKLSLSYVTHTILTQQRWSWFLSEESLSARQTPISRGCCKGDVHKLVLQICPEQPVLKQKCHCKEETSQRCYFLPFPSPPKGGQRQHPLVLCKGRCSLSLWHMIGVEGKETQSTALAIFIVPPTAVLWCAEKMHCRLPVQLECSWGTQVQEGAFPSFSQALFSDIYCHCPSVTPLVVHQGSTTSFADIDVEQAIFSTVLDSLAAEISRGKYVVQNQCIEFCQFSGSRLSHCPCFWELLF